MTQGVPLIPEVKPSEITSRKPTDYLVRFVFGAAISLVAGLIGMKLGPTVGGVLLGFPAILPASLTLIEKKEGKEEASIDSLGAILVRATLCFDEPHSRFNTAMVFLKERSFQVN